MSLNRQGPNKIDWTDVTLNPVVGCTHGCRYCYARRQAKRRKQSCQLCYDFVPHAHLKRLDKLSPKQKPKKIFLDSMWDWCCIDNDPEWMLTILEKISECSQHTFQVLTKQPWGYARYDWPANVWLGVSIDGRDYEEKKISFLRYFVPDEQLKFVSFEPLLGPIEPNLKEIDWVIIGANSNRGAPKPPDEWADRIIEKARQERCAVWVKNNYKYHTKSKEFPGD